MVLVLSAVLRLALIGRGGALYWPDEKRYIDSREAVAAVASGDWAGAADRLLAHSDHFLFRWLALPPAAVERAIYGDLPPHARICAVWLSFASVACLVLVWLIAWRRTRNPTTCDRALLFCACSAALLYYARHCFPYDASLALFLGAVLVALDASSPRRWWSSGFLCGLGYLTYNGYWALCLAPAAILLGAEIRSLRRGSIHTLAFAVGVATPVLAAFVGARLAGYDLLADSVRFAKTVTQGDFGSGGKLIISYLAAADGVVPFALCTLVCVASALALGRGRWRDLSIWAGIVAGLVLAWLTCSDAFHVFVLYGRTVRAVLPFLALAAAEATVYLDTSVRRSRFFLRALVCTLVALGAVRLGPVLRQRFPAEFNADAQEIVGRVRAQDPQARFALSNATYLDHPEPDSEPPAESRTLLAAPHPMAYRPNLFEGCTADRRHAFETHDLTMRLVLLNPGRGLATFTPTHAPIRPAIGTLLIRLVLPPPRLRAEPVEELLVAHGEDGRRVFLVLRYEQDGRIRLGLRPETGQTTYSELLTRGQLGSEHSLVVSLESFFSPQLRESPELAELARASRVRWDGERVLQSTTGAAPAPLASLSIATTAPGLSCAPFSGQVRQTLEVDPHYAAAWEWSSRAVSGPYCGSNHGPVELSAIFPASERKRSEVLLSTGAVGEAEQILVEYLGDSKVRFGIDHWGAPVRYSPSVTISPEQPHAVAVSIGSFYPRDDDALYADHPEWLLLKRWLYLRLDNTVLISEPADSFSTAPDAAAWFRSAVGSSAADSVFTGTKLGVSRRSPDELKLSETLLTAGVSGRTVAEMKHRVDLRLDRPPPAPDLRLPVIRVGEGSDSIVVFLRLLGRDHFAVGIRSGKQPPVMSQSFRFQNGSRRLSVQIRAPAAPVPSARFLVSVDDAPALDCLTSAIEADKARVHVGTTLVDLKWVALRYPAPFLHVETP
jgi:hypothetical protein